jgi:hypothetical protein
MYGAEGIPVAARLRIVSHGPVQLTPDPNGSPAAVSFVFVISIKARSEAEARRALQGIVPRMSNQGGVFTLATPRGPFDTSILVNLPRGLREAVVSTYDGDVEVSSVDAPLRIETGAGRIHVERATNNCKFISSGGEIRIGSVDGSVTAVTAGGKISARLIRGEAMLETGGGDIDAEEIGGPVRASTGAGTVHIGRAGSTVTASTGGGRIVVGQAGGAVTAHNAAGPVQVGTASGLHCETGSGAIRVDNASGRMEVSTAMGSINANLLAGRIAESSFSTANGDITIWIPSNVGVTVRAENEMADSIRRIVSEFPGIPVKLRGSQVVAEGVINGGGPTISLVATGGTIYIKRQ